MINPYRKNKLLSLLTKIESKLTVFRAGVPKLAGGRMAESPGGSGP